MSASILTDSGVSNNKIPFGRSDELSKSDRSAFRKSKLSEINPTVFSAPLVSDFQKSCASVSMLEEQDRCHCDPPFGLIRFGKFIISAPDSRPLCVGNGPVELGINSIRLDVTAFEKFGSRLAVIDHADVLFHGNRCGRTRSRRLRSEEHTSE